MKKNSTLNSQVFNPKQILLVKKTWDQPESPFKKVHQETLRQVCQVLKNQTLPLTIIRREQLKKKVPQDTLVITVGGDGTFLHASHFCLEGQLIVGVNSAPTASYGAFCVTEGNLFKKVFEKIFQSQQKPIRLYRLEIKLNGKTLPTLALNDVLFANKSPAATSRYSIRVGKKEEFQKSSGVWIATPAGSTAGIRSAGGVVLPKTTRQFEFAVRELFLENGSTSTLVRKTLSYKQEVTLVSQMKMGQIYIDGAHVVYPLKPKDEVSFSLSENPIYTLKSDEKKN